MHDCITNDFWKLNSKQKERIGISYRATSLSQNILCCKQYWAPCLCFDWNDVLLLLKSWDPATLYACYMYFCYAKINNY